MSNFTCYLVRFTIGLCYSACSGYALSSYLEYPFLVGQDILLLLMVLHFSGQLGPTVYSGLAGYAAVVYAFIAGLFPHTVITFLMVIAPIKLIMRPTIAKSIYCRACAHQFQLPVNWLSSKPCGQHRTANPCQSSHGPLQPTLAFVNPIKYLRKSLRL